MKTGPDTELDHKKYPPPVIAISGAKNSGKTTLLENIIPLLRGQGLKIAVIKHDGHDFDPDVPGTDSYRLRQAGACGTAVFSGLRYMLAYERANTDFQLFIQYFKDVDIILLEGGKHSNYPKIEVFRPETDCAPLCDPSSLLALYTDTNMVLPGIPSVKPGQYHEIIQIINRYMYKIYPAEALKLSCPDKGGNVHE